MVRANKNHVRCASWREIFSRMPDTPPSESAASGRTTAAAQQPRRLSDGQTDGHRRGSGHLGVRQSPPRQSPHGWQMRKGHNDIQFPQMGRFITAGEIGNGGIQRLVVIRRTKPFVNKYCR